MKYKPYLKKLKKNLLSCVVFIIIGLPMIEYKIYGAFLVRGGGLLK